jgi:Meiotically up-regulated gene 113
MITKPWLYRGGIRTLPDSSAWATGTPALYLLQFPDRCKIGISANPPERLKALQATHRRTCGAGVVMAAISAPSDHAYRIEQNLLNQFGVLRLAGEYLAVDFDTLHTAATAELKRAEKLRSSAPPSSGVGEPVLNVAGAVPVRELSPRVLRVAHGAHSYAVEWNLHETAPKVSEWRTLRRHFSTHAAAVRFCLEMWQIWLATLTATGLSRDRVLGLANS